MSRRQHRVEQKAQIKMSPTQQTQTRERRTEREGFVFILMLNLARLQDLKINFKKKVNSFRLKSLKTNEQ